MKYDLLLFDADDTLLDFKKSEDISFKIILEKNNIRGDIKALHESYKLINNHLWSQIALGTITKDYLKVERFNKFIEVNKLSADPQKLCDDYLETLPNQVFLIEGARDLLQSLHGKVPLVIITNGIGVTQHKRLANSGIKPFIDLMVISEECGFSKPDRRIFDYTLELLNKTKDNSKMLMIGDRIETDILGAKNFNIESCWFNPEQEINSSETKPTFEIQNILEILNIIKA